MKAKMACRSTRIVGRDPKGKAIREPVGPGDIIDHPKAYLLVRLGMARPADEECRLAAGMSAEQQEKAIREQQRTARGILPEDWPAFDRGEIDGYDENGNPIPGPNVHAVQEDEEYSYP